MSGLRSGEDGGSLIITWGRSEPGWWRTSPHLAAWRDRIGNRKWRHGRREARDCPGNGEPGRRRIRLSPGIYTHGTLVWGEPHKRLGEPVSNRNMRYKEHLGNGEV